jgi:tRNA nucleotidyltransferase (CCA-adding enzyme)
MPDIEKNLTELGKKVPHQLKDIADHLHNEGGEAYLVGGAVVDHLLGHEIKDWDIEVFGLSYENLLDILSQYGHTDLIGSKFGVVKLVADLLDMEFTVPRLENSTGPKHQDFDIQLIPSISVEQAGHRRDFTINSIYYDIKHDLVVDPFAGIAALKAGLICHIDDETFPQDPLRAYRAIQLCARKGKTICPHTQGLIRSMLEECAAIPGEAIYGELTKCLMKAEKPSVGLQFLKGTQLIYNHPELAILIGARHRPDYHPEGDVWNHTLMVIDEAARYRDELPEEWRLGFMWGMLLHDVGKPATYDPETGSTLQHDKKGEAPARACLGQLTQDKDLTDKAVSIVRSHMRARLLLKASPRKAAWRRLQNICPLNILAYVSMCDEDGRGDPNQRLGKDDPVFKRCTEIYKELGAPEREIKPILMGRHLIAVGHKPGVQFGVMLKKAYEYQLDEGCEDVDTLLEVATKPV